MNISIRKFCFIFAVLSLLFLNSNFAVAIGFGDNVTTVSYIFILLYIAIRYTSNGYSIRKANKYIRLLLFFGFFCVVFYSIKTPALFKYFLTFCLIPPIIYVYFDSMQDWERAILRNCLLLVLFVEAGVAVYERITLTNLFADDEFANNMNIYATWQFRSPALFGHPIANAMIVSAINIFVLASEYISDQKKLFVFFLTMIALLCFNERANIIFTFIFSIPYLYDIYNKNRRNINISFCFSVLFVIFVVFICYAPYSDIGGRLFNREIGMSDESSSARLIAVYILKYLDENTLLYGGTNDSYLDMV